MTLLITLVLNVYVHYIYIEYQYYGAFIEIFNEVLYISLIESD